MSNQTQTPNDQISLTFHVKKEDLLAMRLLQSVDEARFVLNGVHFEIWLNKNQVIMVATNGRYMGVLRPNAIIDGKITGTGFEEPVRFTVDYPLVKYLEKRTLDTILIHYSGTQVRFEGSDQAVTYDAIKGDFPKWRQCVPQGAFAPFDISVNARYVSVFEKVAKLLGGTRGEQVILKGHKLDPKHDVSAPLSSLSVFIPSLVDKEFYGVVMPMQQPEVRVPEWIKLPAPPVLPPKAPDVIIANYQTPTPIPPDSKPGQPYGKTFLGTSEKGFTPIAQPGYSLWIEWGKWYTAPTVDPEKFGTHAYDGGGYERGIRECLCGCHMGESSSSGPVDPFGACPCNGKVVETSPPQEPAPVHPIIATTMPKPADERKKYVHISNSRPGKNLDRSRRHRHAKKRKNLHVQRRARRGSNR